MSKPFFLFDVYISVFFLLLTSHYTFEKRCYGFFSTSYLLVPFFIFISFWCCSCLYTYALIKEHFRQLYFFFLFMCIRIHFMFLLANRYLNRMITLAVNPFSDTHQNAMQMKSINLDCVNNENLAK